ncbi:MAG: TauD/TfdA family dioxygenase [Gammaproteobacteria bacterium]|nr:TauD/TfdA family dioxygenase [Gammaproteobacteria bacterium]
MSYAHIRVRPLTGALGAEVEGVDLAAPIADPVFDEIRRAFLDHLVVFFRGQKLTPARQVAFGRRFGGIHLHPYIRGLDEQPEVIRIVKTEQDTDNFGGVWHSDQMFTPRPALGTALYAKEVPPAGGDTLFANMYLAYESLSEGMKALVGRMRTFNVGDRFKQKGGRTRAERYRGRSSMAVKEPDADQVTEAEHPLVRTHPETGRKALYLGVHTQRFAGMTEAESEPLLAFLAEHAVRPEFTCRFRWEPGSLALWDNRCTQHLAVNDYPGARRVMHRITIEGDAPF